MGKLNRTHASYILEDYGFGVYSWDEDGSRYSSWTQGKYFSEGFGTATIKGYGIYLGNCYSGTVTAYSSGHDGGSIVDILDSVSYAVGDRSTTRPTPRLASEKSQGVSPGLASYMRRRVWVKS